MVAKIRKREGGIMRQGGGVLRCEDTPDCCETAHDCNGCLDAEDVDTFTETITGIFTCPAFNGAFPNCNFYDVGWCTVSDAYKDLVLGVDHNAGRSSSGCCWYEGYTGVGSHWATLSVCTGSQLDAVYWNTLTIWEDDTETTKVGIVYDNGGGPVLFPFILRKEPKATTNRNDCTDFELEGSPIACNCGGTYLSYFYFNVL